MGQPNSMTDPLLAEQLAYYRAIAPEYEEHFLTEPGADELHAAVENFGVVGHVLELACGPGVWTGVLLQRAASLTAVDGSPEMLARCKARFGSDRTRFIQADLFSWKPDRRYDVVFFGSWLSHVPLEQFEEFWELVASCLEPKGRVLFLDDAFRPAEELIEGEASATVQRRLKNGTPFRAVKVPHRAAELQVRLEHLGWNIRVTAVGDDFYWGAGTRGTGTLRAR